MRTAAESFANGLTPMQRALVEADVRDVRWLLDQAAAAGQPVSEWWLAGVRAWGYPPPPRSACAPTLIAKQEAAIADWTVA